MSLIDEAKTVVARTGPVSTIDALVSKLLADGRPVDADEVTELLRAPVVGSAAAARVLSKHFSADAGRTITRMMVQQWRGVNL